MLPVLTAALVATVAGTTSAVVASSAGVAAARATVGVPGTAGVLLVASRLREPLPLGSRERADTSKRTPRDVY